MSFITDQGASSSIKEHNSKISVWWDYENCEVPSSFNSGLIVNYVTAALMKLSLSGPIIFSAYGDVKRIPDDILKAMNHTGITMINVPEGKIATELRMIVDMSMWAIQNPTPATYVLISGDKDFFYPMNRLRHIGYRIVLAWPENGCSSRLFTAAHHSWCWTDLCMGHLSAVQYNSPIPRRLSFGSQTKRGRTREDQERG